MEIKDSGERRAFGSGAVRDMSEGKGRMDLLPWAAIMEVAKHCENGAKKYGEHNVDKGIPTHSLCDSAARHLAKYLDGWDDEPHLLAAAWNLLWAIQMEIKHPEMVDTPFVDTPTDTPTLNQPCTNLTPREPDCRDCKYFVGCECFSGTPCCDLTLPENRRLLNESNINSSNT
jgi:hypothetical protein